ncbi:MAG TPA: malto-oligosyltrehalose trehalohydrolase [Gemmataceae bacterium]|nr:malto-oligosyltrehalose trehalohydrolase [Gemmataceae bacterium]
MGSRRYAIGAERNKDGSTHFRLWAPQSKRVEVVLESGKRDPIPLTAEAGGYFSGRIADVPAGTLYRYRLDGAAKPLPDPASRFQPEGPHGPSQVVDPFAFRWSDASWTGVPADRRVVYEMHVGTFTTEGTWTAAERELRTLADVGITMIEVMPVADFPGRFGWGYDGVNFFAPTRLYGSPDDFRHFVDTAHALQVGVILDVVYNHFGPDGNYLTQFSKDYFTDRYQNEWGMAINFDGPNSAPVREFILTNADYWIEEFHLDGLRLDATQQIFDQSTPHLLTELSQRTRAAAKGRTIFLVAENETQHADLVRPVETGGKGLDALWNDDFHHSAVVALTGHNEAYYSDHLGKPQEFISAAKWGYLFQGQRYSWQKQRRGRPALDLGPTNFVAYLENHDQVANSASGQRLRLQTSPGRWRAMTALLLLGPATPMLFQGQEFGSTRPFFFFANHHPELAELVGKGRREFLSQFASIKEFRLAEKLPSPHEMEAFQRCKLDPAERCNHTEQLALHRDLLALRRNDLVFRASLQRGVDGAVLGPAAFLLRYLTANGDDRLLIVNLGRTLKLREAPEPLLAPPAIGLWQMLWSSEAPEYGGTGHAPLESDDGWLIPGESAVVLAPETAKPDLRSAD